MPVLIKVTKNTIKDSKALGKYFGHIVATSTMSYQQLCKHMAEHNSVYGEDVCLGVANKLQNCMLEQLLEGKKVQFGDLGTFYLAAKGTGADTEEAYNVGTNIDGIYLRFAPSRQDVNDLTSKTLKKKATLMNVKDLLEPAKSKKDAETTDTESGSDADTGSGSNTQTDPENQSTGGGSNPSTTPGEGD